MKLIDIDKLPITDDNKKTLMSYYGVEAVTVEYIQRWMDDHHEYMNVRPLRFMVQDYRMEKKDDDV